MRWIGGGGGGGCEVRETYLIVLWSTVLDVVARFHRIVRASRPVTRHGDKYVLDGLAVVA